MGKETRPLVFFLARAGATLPSCLDAGIISGDIEGAGLVLGSFGISVCPVVGICSVDVGSVWGAFGSLTAPCTVAFHLCFHQLYTFIITPYTIAFPPCFHQLYTFLIITTINTKKLHSLLPSKHGGVSIHWTGTLDWNRILECPMEATLLKDAGIRNIHYY